MKTVAHLEKEILDITMKINQEFPELSKYLQEMPVPVTENDAVNSKNLEAYHSSLLALLGKYSKTHTGKKEEAGLKPLSLMSYPASEDIYNKGIKETEINPNDLSKNKAPNDEEGVMNEKGFKGHMTGDDLDVPGSELDDQQEEIGSEDEENNYYSLGGDNHDDLEEDKD